MGWGGGGGGGLGFFGAKVSNKKIKFLFYFPPGGPRGGAGGGGGHTVSSSSGTPGPAQAQSGQNGPGSHSDTPNGAFMVVPKASHRRLQVQDPGDRGPLPGHCRVPFDTI